MNRLRMVRHSIDILPAALLLSLGGLAFAQAPTPAQQKESKAVVVPPATDSDAVRKPPENVDPGAVADPPKTEGPLSGKGSAKSGKGAAKDRKPKGSKTAPRPATPGKDQGREGRMQKAP